MAAFFYAKYFAFLCVLPLFSFPYNCKRKASGTNTSRKASACTTRAKAKASACTTRAKAKASACTTRAKAKANACTTRAKAKANACTTSRAGRKAARQSVEQIRLTVSGLVTANVQAHGSWVRARTDYAGRSASCVKIVDCMNLFRISHASVRA